MKTIPYPGHTDQLIEHGPIFKVILILIVLGISSPVKSDFTTHQSPDLTLGQDSLNGGFADNLSVHANLNGLAVPQGMDSCESKNLTFVSDSYNHRVLVYRTASPANGQTPDFVLGQPDFNSSIPNKGGISRQSLYYPRNIFCDDVNDRLYITDSANNRVLIYDNISQTIGNQIPATWILGQRVASGGTTGTSAGTMSGPSDVSAVAGKIIVADSGNNRILIWTRPISEFGQAADLVLGQSNFTSNVQGTSAKDFRLPQGIWTDGVKLIVADTYNHRLLQWNLFPTANYSAADIVVGQPDFNSGGINSGGSAAPGTFSYPFLVTSWTDGGARRGVIVGDKWNHRIQIFDTVPLQNQQTPHIWFPLGGVTSGGTDKHFYALRGAHVESSGRIWVIDEGNNRLVSFPNIAVDRADREIGHEGRFNRVAANNGPFADGLRSPHSVAIDGSRLYLTDRDNNRVLIFNDYSRMVLRQNADYTLGQTGMGEGDIIDPPTNSTLNSPYAVATDGQRLYVGTSDRILWWNSVESWHNNKPADGILGQSVFSGKGNNNASVVDAAKLNNVMALVHDGKALYAADYGNHRVLIWTRPITQNGQAADLVLGHKNFSNFTIHDGQGSPRDYSMAIPHGLSTDGRYLYVAEYSGARVSVFDLPIQSNGQPATFVLGQPDFNSLIRDPSSITADSLETPLAVFGDGKRLWIGEYVPGTTTRSNGGRILIYSQTPNRNGVAADLVWGAPNPASWPEYSSISRDVHYPSGIQGFRNQVFVTDRSYHRVTRFTDTQSNYVQVRTSSIVDQTVAQELSAAVLKIQLKATIGATSSWRTFRAFLSSGETSDIEGLQLYRDDGDGLFNPNTDIPITGVTKIVTANRYFEVPISPIESISSSEKTYWATIKLSQTAMPDRQVAIDVMENNYFFDFGSDFVDLGLQIWKHSSELTVRDNPDRLQIEEIIDITPTIFRTDAKSPLARLTLRASKDTVYIQSLDFHRTGDVGEDVSLEVFQDDGDGLFDEAKDALISPPAPFINEMAHIVTLPIAVTTRSQHFFLIAKVPASATMGTFGVQLKSNPTPISLVGFPQDDTVDEANLQFQTGLGTITNHRDNMVMLLGDDATPSRVFQGDRVPLLIITANTDIDVAFMNRVRFQRLGVGLDTDVAAVEFWADKGSEGFNPAEDRLVASAPLSGGESELTFAPIEIQTEPSIYYGVCRLDAKAQAGNKIGLRMNNKEFFGLVDINTTVDEGAFPIQSNEYVIDNTIDEVTLTSLNVAPGVITQGETKAFMRLDLSVNSNAATLRGLSIRKNGTALDTDIQSVTIYRDSDNNGTWSTNDEKISAGVEKFFSGRADVTLSQIQEIGTTVRRFFVGLKIDPKAKVGEKVSIELSTMTSVDILGPDRVLKTGFPHRSTDASIAEFPDVVTVSGDDLVPTKGFLAGARSVVMARLMLNANLADAPLSQLQVDLLGSIQDVDGLKLFWDANGDNIFGPQDQLVANGSYGAGTFSFSNLSELVVTTPKTYFLLLDVAPNAQPGRVIGLQIPSNGYLTVASPNLVDPAGFPFKTKLGLILEPASIMNVTSIVGIHPNQAVQTTEDVPMIAITSRMNQFTGEWISLRVDRLGQSFDSDIRKIKLYEDRNANHVVDLGIDPLIAASIFETGSAVLQFKGNPQTINATTERTYLIAIDISGEAEPGSMIGLEIASGGSFTLTEPDTAGGSFPINSGFVEVLGTIDTLTVSANILSPANTLQDAQNVLLARLTMKADGHTIRLEQLSLEKLGDLPDNGIREIHLYEDNLNEGIAGSLDETDMDVAFGEPLFISGKAHLKIDPMQTISVTQRNYFLTVDIDTRATPGKKLGIHIPTPDFISIKSPDKIDTSGFPIKSTLTTILDRPDTVSVSTSAPSKLTVDQGSKDNALLLLQLKTNIDMALLEKLRIDLLGNLTENYISDVSIFVDSNKSGTLEPHQDLRLSKGLFQGNIANLKLDPLGTISEDDSLLFLSVSLSIDAPMDSTIALGLSDKNYFTVLAPDTMAPLQGRIKSPVFRVRDIRVPTTPVVTDRGDFTNTVLSLIFDWTSKTLVGELAEARYAIGTNPGSSNVRGWTEFPIGSKTFRADNLALSNGQTYYISIQVQSDLGFWSEIGHSNGITVDIEKLPQPTGGVQVFKEKDGFVLHWAVPEETISGISGYQLHERSAHNPAWQIVFPDQTVHPMPAEAPSMTTTIDATFVFKDKEPGTYWFRVLAINGVGTPGQTSEEVRVDWQLNEMPEAITEASNYPNPFDARKGTTKIVYVLRADTTTDLEIFDGFGRKVRSMTFSPGQNGARAGANEVEWDGATDTGEKVSQGVYILSLKSESAKKTWKVGVWH